MAYIGNDLQVAYQSYQIIDDISGSFNGSTTSFALLVGGVAPVPFPINEQQCLISVGGVIQEPDPTGTNGFKFSGGNIVFSSAPGTGEDFFGVILAGADYVNVGVNYPSGSVSTPSITFDTDLDTGIYNPAENELGLVTNGNDAIRINSSGDVTLGSDLDVNGNISCNGIDMDGPFEQASEAVSALNVDCSAGNYFTKAIASNSTFTFSNIPTSGNAYSFTLEVDVTGTSTAITWPASVKWPADTAPSLTDTKTHLFMFVTNDGGTTWRGAALVDYTT